MSKSGLSAPKTTLGMILNWDCRSDQPAIVRVRDYWRSKQKGRLMPSRHDIVAAELRDILPILQIYEVLDGGNAYRIRLLGTKIASAFDSDPTGKVFDRNSNDPLTARMLAVFKHVAQERMPLIAYADRTAVEKMSFTSVESIYLPLSENWADVHAVLAATVFGGEAAQKRALPTVASDVGSP